jgi:hypothetical protein
MLHARAPKDDEPRRPGEKDDEPRRPGEEILSTKALLLLIIAGGVAYLWVYSPVVGAAVLAGITVLTLLWGKIS